MHLKNCVGGSSADRVWMSQYHARRCEHFGHVVSVVGKSGELSSITATPFLVFLDVILTFSIAFVALPQLLHISFPRWVIIIPPHEQNCIQSLLVL